MQVHIEISDEWKTPQSLDEIGLSGADLLVPLSSFDAFGAWRYDINSSQVYWSPDIYKIHGMEPKQGPVNVSEAIASYHPDDRKIVADCLEEAIRRKSGFRFTLRLINYDGNPQLVKATAIFRHNDHGEPELYGTFSLCEDHVRSVAVGP